MGLSTVPEASVTLPTRRTVVFTSSTTWTVPSSCIYADVMVVGGGQGGCGGYRATAFDGGGGTGGAITISRNVYLGGTGTVSVTIGAGGTGAAGVATTVLPVGNSGGFSAFGTHVYSSGGSGFNTSSSPGYKGTTNEPYNGSDITLANYSPYMINGLQTATSANVTVPIYNSAQGMVYDNNNGSGHMMQSLDGESIGYSGGKSSAGGSRGGYPGGIVYTSQNRNGIVPQQALPWNAGSTFTIGTPTAGAVGGNGGGAGGTAGIVGFSGGGGASGSAAGAAGGAGGPGGGGGGGNANGTTGGNGGNAGTNSGAGGGSGGSTGSTGGGTGGNGGNGGAGFIIVSYIGTN